MILWYWDVYDGGIGVPHMMVPMRLLLTFALQILELQRSIKELQRTRLQKEKMFDREKSEFKRELDSRLRQIEELKRESDKTRVKMQVGSGAVSVSLCIAVPTPAPYSHPTCVITFLLRWHTHSPLCCTFYHCRKWRRKAVSAQMRFVALATTASTAAVQHTQSACSRCFYVVVSFFRMS